MLSPKEKAKELFNKFFPYVEAMSSRQQDENAKQCVLIAVDEILDLMINTFKWDEKHNGNIEYWQEVKNEVKIFKL